VPPTAAAAATATAAGEGKGGYTESGQTTFQLKQTRHNLLLDLAYTASTSVDKVTHELQVKTRLSNGINAQNNCRNSDLHNY